MLYELDKDIEWSLKTWKERHENDYFPRSEQHADWKIYTEPPEWLIRFGLPTSNDETLEIGCGYGEWMIPLSPYVKNIVGIDIHGSIILKAREEFSRRKIKNCHAFVSDGVTIPFPRERFTLVYSISVFQHIPKKLTCNYLREAFRVTETDGRGLFHFRNADNVGDYPEPAQDITENHTGDFSCGWTVSEVLHAGADAGWSNCRVEDIGLFLVLIGERT